MEGDLPKDELGQRLHAQGWKQGTIFSAPSLFFLSNHLPPQTEGKGFGRRAVRPNERLIIVSQDCDIVAPQDTEPCVEALICTVEENAGRIKNLEANSARSFVVDPGNGLIAQAKDRVLLTKALLATLDPQPWPTDEARHQRFVRWLARRLCRYRLAPGAPLEHLAGVLDASPDSERPVSKHSVCLHEWASEAYARVEADEPEPAGSSQGSNAVHPHRTRQGRNLIPLRTVAPAILRVTCQSAGPRRKECRPACRGAAGRDVER
jgi:hypothetical protein